MSLAAAARVRRPSCSARQQACSAQRSSWPWRRGGPVVARSGVVHGARRGPAGQPGGRGCIHLRAAIRGASCTSRRRHTLFVGADTLVPQRANPNSHAQTASDQRRRHRRRQRPDARLQSTCKRPAKGNTMGSRHRSRAGGAGSKSRFSRRGRGEPWPRVPRRGTDYGVL